MHSSVSDRRPPPYWSIMTWSSSTKWLTSIKLISNHWFIFLAIYLYLCSYIFSYIFILVHLQFHLETNWSLHDQCFQIAEQSSVDSFLNIFTSFYLWYHFEKIVFLHPPHFALAQGLVKSDSSIRYRPSGLMDR